MFSWTNRLSTHFAEGFTCGKHPISHTLPGFRFDSRVGGHRTFEVRRPVGGGFSNVKGTVTVNDVERNPPVVEVDIV